MKRRSTPVFIPKYFSNRKSRLISRGSRCRRTTSARVIRTITCNRRSIRKNNFTRNHTASTTEQIKLSLLSNTSDSSLNKFAALTSILAKVGISNVESNLGTAIRTGVVLVMAWLIVFMKGKQSHVVLVMSWMMVFVTGKGKLLRAVPKNELGFICLSGLATGGSWLCYYYAIQNGIVSVVVPIDKLSILISIGFSYFVFKEKLTKKAFAGLLLMVCGTLAMAIWA